MQSSVVNLITDRSPAVILEVKGGHCMHSLFDELNKIEMPVVSDNKVKYEFQEIGKELQPIYGKLIWTLFYKPGFTEFKIREAHKIAQRRKITSIRYLIGIINNFKF